MKKNFYKQDFIKIINICSSKDTANKMTWQRKLKKIYFQHISDKRNVSRIHKRTPTVKTGKRQTTQLENGHKTKYPSQKEDT